MLFELDVIDTVCHELEKHGYEIVSRKKEIKHSGKDIICKKNGEKVTRMLYIEAVGETSSESSSKRYGKPFDRSQVKVHISELLFAVAEAMSMSKLDIYDYKVAFAIPDNNDHRDFFNKISHFLDSIGIAVFFVKSGFVSEIISTWEL
ncbi:hypothetical protein ACNQFZ_19920 [Schinkia sp. CFF1]